MLQDKRYSSFNLTSLPPLIPFIIPTFFASRVLILKFVSAFVFFTVRTYSTLWGYSLVIYFDWSLYVILELSFESVRISVFVSHHSISKHIIWSSWITITIIKVIYFFMFYWIHHLYIMKIKILLLFQVFFSLCLHISALSLFL